MKNIFTAFIIMMSVGLAAPSCRTTVTTRPPAIVVKRPPAPVPGFVWAEGRWYRSRGAWVQQPGRWIRRRRGRTYIPGRWVQTRKGYYWKNGYWR